MSERLAQLEKNVNTARALATATTRAQTLWDDGYTYERWRSQPERFWVYRPAEDFANDGRRHYLVNVAQQRCTCEFWAHFNICKHLMAINEVDQMDRWADEQAAWSRDNENGRFAMEYAD